jgi:hypothetical protein
MMEEHRSKIVKKWVFRNEVTAHWRRLHNVQLNNVYSSPNIFREMKSRRRWAVARVGEIINAYKILLSKREGSWRK